MAIFHSYVSLPEGIEVKKWVFHLDFWVITCITYDNFTESKNHG